VNKQRTWWSMHTRCARYLCRRRRQKFSCCDHHRRRCPLCPRNSAHCGTVTTRPVQISANHKNFGIEQQWKLNTEHPIFSFLTWFWAPWCDQALSSQAKISSSLLRKGDRSSEYDKKFFDIKFSTLLDGRCVWILGFGASTISGQYLLTLLE
jgi:hypothetical protein